MLQLDIDVIMDNLNKIVSDFSGLADLNFQAIESLAQVKFEKTADSNEYFDIYDGKGSNFISRAEVRIGRSDSHKKLLIVWFSDTTQISEQDVLAKYPQLKPNGPTDMHHPDEGFTSVIAVESWGKMVFEFNRSGILTDAVFDTI